MVPSLAEPFDRVTPPVDFEPGLWDARDVDPLDAGAVDADALEAPDPDLDAFGFDDPDVDGVDDGRPEDGLRPFGDPAPADRLPPVFPEPFPRFGPRFGEDPFGRVEEGRLLPGLAPRPSSCAMGGGPPDRPTRVAEGLNHRF